MASLAPVLPPAAAKVPVFPRALVKPAPPTIAFGKEQWGKYLGEVGEEPPLPSDIHQILQSPCPFFPGKKVEETHLLTLIPKTVNGKPLTLDSLEELVKHPKQGQPTRFSSYSDEIKKEYGRKFPERSYWTLMTRDVIPASRGKIYNDQVQLLKKYSQKAQVSYEMPKLLEAATSILTEYFRTGERLYTYSPGTFTRCQEGFSEHRSSFVVGGFLEGGLAILCTDFRVGLARSYDGLGGLRKF
ncbi:MAG: hypothetical protein JSS10_08655 [Verrucomicrobia bacterium]|nr:hypothetical protein [Verrucomicrobiota bacterium]